MPRSTGKSTWLRQVLPGARAIDLLNESELIRFARDPTQLGAEVAALPDGTWAGFGVTLGAHPERHGRVDVLPLQEFFRALHAGEIIRV